MVEYANSCILIFCHSFIAITLFIDSMIESSNKDTSTTQKYSRAKVWHYVPSLPIQVSDYFRSPFSLFAILKWIFNGWFPISERLVIVVLSVLSWVLFHPAIEACIELEFSWVAQIYIRNLFLLILVAGGLHLHFYIWRKQGDNLHYDSRPLARDNKKFSFKSQILDNMFWSIVSGVSVWSAYEVLMMWSMANGYIPMLLLPDDYPLLMLLIFLVPIWETLYFFIIHRLLHWRPLYRTVHYLHHRNTNVGPWSGMSMHPVEHLIYFGTILVHFIVPANPLLIIYHLQYYSLSAISTHTGYRGFKVGGLLILPLGTFHHQLHHRYFECNYGGLEIPMDKWTGSFHDGTDDSHQQFIAKLRHNAVSKG